MSRMNKAPRDTVVDYKGVGMGLDWLRVIEVTGQIGGFVWREYRIK